MHFDARVGCCLSGSEVISQENDSPLFSDRNRDAFSGVQFLSSDSCFIGFDEFVREVGQPVRNATGVDLLVNRLWDE